MTIDSDLSGVQRQTVQSDPVLNCLKAAVYVHYSIDTAECYELCVVGMLHVIDTE